MSDRVSPGEPWVSVEQVANHLGVAKDTVYRWIDSKGLPAHRIGRLWKFKLSDVDDWVRVSTDNDIPGKSSPKDNRRSR